MGPRLLVSIILSSAFVVVPFFYDIKIIDDVLVENQVAEIIHTKEIQVPSNPKLVFVGDMMLGRFVERLIADRGITYPFQNMRVLISTPDLAIGNFEGVISEDHERTPSGGFQFSIRNKYLTYIRDLGFDVLSLANNHSFDFGSGALNYTRKICKELDLLCGGSPKGIDEYSTIVKKVNDINFGFLFMQTVSAPHDDDALNTAVTTLMSKSDIQIVVIHWGDEYVLAHNQFQQQLAEKLIDSGFDAVIGHHPHVVQDVALYKDKPIFYSLGNFIFDQYFSTDVQEGLVVTMDVHESTIVYALVPITSVAQQTQPDFMSNSETDIMNERILQNIKNEPGVDTSLGTIVVGRSQLES